MPYYYWSIDDAQVSDTEHLEHLAILIGSCQARLLTAEELSRAKQPSDHNRRIREELSRLKERIPLYDIKSGRIYLIHWENVYIRVTKEHYRLVDESWYRRQKALGTTKSTQNLRIMDAYDLDILTASYAQVFLESFQKWNYQTSCVRRSYYPGSDHLEPYYRYNELVYLANDWNLTRSLTPSEQETEHLCALIMEKDIPASTLIEHQLHISKQNCIGLVKHYSLFGSYFVNQYLRKTGCCLTNMLPDDSVIDTRVRNAFLESQIASMIHLIAEAPAFSEEYTVYRFVSHADYIAGLQVGDTYSDPSFTSTTRNPFHYQDNHAFGYILLRIRLPAGIKGLGLCIESYSNFPGEQEIVLMPTSKYRLDAIETNEHNIEYHKAFDLKVHRKYDMTWISHDYLKLSPKDKIPLSTRKLPISEIPIIDPVKIASGNELADVPISVRLTQFLKTLSENGQFRTTVDGQEYLMVVESYNSTTVYSPFFFWERSDGIMITHYHPKLGSVSLLMEIGRTMHVNYYFRYSVSNRVRSKTGGKTSDSVCLESLAWVTWLASICYVLGCEDMVIHSDYQLRPYRAGLSDLEKIEHTKYTYSADIYQYLKHKHKRFQDFPEISCSFDHSQLDSLQYASVDKVVDARDRNELYSIWKTSGLENVYQFYLYILEHRPIMRTTLEAKISASDIYPSNTVNPFQECYYTLQPWSFLQNRGWLRYAPLSEEFLKACSKRKRMIGDGEGMIHQFQNRMRDLVQIRERFV